MGAGSKPQLEPPARPLPQYADDTSVATGRKLCRAPAHRSDLAIGRAANRTVTDGPHHDRAHFHPGVGSTVQAVTDEEAPPYHPHDGRRLDGTARGLDGKTSPKPAGGRRESTRPVSVDRSAFVRQWLSAAELVAWPGSCAHCACDVRNPSQEASAAGRARLDGCHLRAHAVRLSLCR